MNALNGVLWGITRFRADADPFGADEARNLRIQLRLARVEQLGDQDADIVGMVRGITKYAEMLTDPRCIRHQLEKAWYLAAAGRPGPCWLDIPVDVQSGMIDETTLAVYDPFVDELLWDVKEIGGIVVSAAGDSGGVRKSGSLGRRHFLRRS